MKVFEEISDVLPSDAYQMGRSSLLHHENPGISDIGQKSCFSSKSQDFPRLESTKALQTCCTSTALRVRCSVRFLGHYSRRNMRKTTKNQAKIDRKRIQNQADLSRNWIFDSHSWGRPQPLQGWF